MLMISEILKKSNLKYVYNKPGSFILISEIFSFKNFTKGLGGFLGASEDWVDWDMLIKCCTSLTGLWTLNA